MADVVLDAKGLNCPLPILPAKKALKELPSGGTPEVQATDPGVVKDSEAFCRSTANELVEHHVDGKTYVFTIRHAGLLSPGPQNSACSTRRMRAVRAWHRA